MTNEIKIAGFGGQGVLSMGMTLSYAGVLEDRQVVWMPSYGPEMRGGTANCTVIISNNRISSPIINQFDTAIILNQPSMDKFEKSVKPEGQIFYESNNVINPPTREDIALYEVPAAIEAVNMKHEKSMNMIMLGAFLRRNPIVSIDSILKALKKVLPERHHHLIPANENALKRGMTLVKEPVLS